jgi:hypothetical protein
LTPAMLLIGGVFKRILCYSLGTNGKKEKEQALDAWVKMGSIFAARRLRPCLAEVSEGVPSPPVEATNEWNVLLASIVRAIRDRPPSLCTSRRYGYEGISK